MTSVRFPPRSPVSFHRAPGQIESPTRFSLVGEVARPGETGGIALPTYRVRVYSRREGRGEKKFLKNVSCSRSVLPFHFVVFLLHKDALSLFDLIFIPNKSCKISRARARTHTHPGGSWPRAHTGKRDRDAPCLPPRVISRRFHAACFNERGEGAASTRLTARQEAEDTSENSL